MLPGMVEDAATAFMHETSRIIAEAIARAVPAADRSAAADRLMSVPLVSTDAMATLMASQILHLAAHRLRSTPPPATN